MKRSGYIKRRGRSRFPKLRDPKYEAWIKQLACLVCLRRPVEPAHLKCRSTGGPDRKNIVPLCHEHHSEQEGRTREFERRYARQLQSQTLREFAEYLDNRYTGRDLAWLLDDESAG